MALTQMRFMHSHKCVLWHSYKCILWHSHKCILWHSHKCLLWHSQKCVLWHAHKCVLLHSHKCVLWHAHKCVLWRSLKSFRGTHTNAFYGKHLFPLNCTLYTCSRLLCALKKKNVAVDTSRCFCVTSFGRLTPLVTHQRHCRLALWSRSAQLRHVTAGIKLSLGLTAGVQCEKASSFTLTTCFQMASS